MHHGDLRQTHGRHAGLVGKGAAAFNENFTLVHQVGAAAFHQRNQWQLVFLRNLLHAQALLQAHGRHRATFDSTVAGRYHTALT